MGERPISTRVTYALSMGVAASTYAPLDYKLADVSVASTRLEVGAAKGNPMALSDELVEAKLKVLEASTDTKFADLRGEMKAMNASLAALVFRFDDFNAKLQSAPTDLAALKERVLHLPSKGFVVTSAIGTITGLTGILVLLGKIGLLS